MKSIIVKALGLLFVLIFTSPVTIGAWMVNDKTLLGTFNEIVESNK